VACALQLVVQYSSTEQFQISNDKGLPLVLLDTITPKKQVYFAELNQGDIEDLVRNVSPSRSVGDLLNKMNTMLKEYDPFTYDNPYKMIRKNEINDDTTQLLIYRDGKMYGFFVEYSVSSGRVIVTGFVLEQDIKTYMGDNGEHSYTYPISNELMYKNNEQIEALLQQQASAIYQDRGFNSYSFC
jgi:hypothetical protein